MLFRYNFCFLLPYVLHYYFCCCVSQPIRATNAEQLEIESEREYCVCLALGAQLMRPDHNLWILFMRGINAKFMRIKRKCTRSMANATLRSVKHKTIVGGVQCLLGDDAPK